MGRDSLEAMQKHGSAFVDKTGRFHRAPREIQEIKLSGCAEIRQNMQNRRHRIPAVDEHMGGYFRIGAHPAFADIREHESRTRGYPRDDNKTLRIIGIIWLDVQKGESLRLDHLPHLVSKLQQRPLHPPNAWSRSRDDSGN